MKRTHEQMAGSASGTIQPPPSGRARVTARQPFRMEPVASEATRGAVQQLVMQLVFAGQSVDRNRCECRG
jgi:hypothetical protein